MQRFFQYLDRHYIETNSILNLTDQGIKQFKHIIMERLLVNFNNAILFQIAKEREGEMIDTDLLK